ncbi:MAG: Mut7-C RNAse domain-containing protein [Chitinispirillaceae bacterium]
MEENRATFRFYEELNDFLPPERRKRRFEVRFKGNPAIKDTIESLNVPHTEVDLILINGKSVPFSQKLNDNENVSVYPVFESMDITTTQKLRPAPLRQVRFVLDVHLGKLARLLRLLGFDCLYRNDFLDEEIVRIASEQNRTVLTRDIGILKQSKVTHGRWIRSRKPLSQLKETIQRFNLCSQIKPFSRCMMCNGLIHPVSKKQVQDMLEEKTKQHYDEFARCSRCGKVYWKGSHYGKLDSVVKEVCGN